MQYSMENIIENALNLYQQNPENEKYQRFYLCTLRLRELDTLPVEWQEAITNELMCYTNNTDLV